MKEDPLVSIDCITYNHAPYIRQCLESFLKQKTNFPFEILIHDDASTDGTADIIREYEERYPNIIKPIYQSENQYSKAISISTKYNFPRAKGKYIALCEGDDYWIDPLKLQKQVDLLENNSDCSLCCGGYQKQTELEKQLICEKKEDLFFKFDLEDWSKKWLTKTLTVIFRSEFLQEYLSITYKYRRDIHLFYFLLKKGKGLYLSEILGVYNIHETGICSMVAKNVNAMHSYSCYKEIFEYYEDDISRKMFLTSVKLRLVYRSDYDTIRTRFLLWKKGIYLENRVLEILKISLIALLPLFVLRLYFKDC